MNFFRHFTVKKTSFPLLAERLSFLYIEWFAYKYAIGGEDFRGKLCLRIEISCVPQGNKEFENLNDNFVRKKD